MATVTGDLFLTFERAEHHVAVLGDVEPFSLGVLDATTTAVPGLDLDALVALWGPLQSASWTVAVDLSPTVIPAPPAVLLLGGAFAFLFGVRRWWA